MYVTEQVIKTIGLAVHTSCNCVLVLLCVTVYVIDLFSSEHDVCCPLQAVDDGFTTGVQVVVLVLDHRVVDVHGRNKQLAALRQLVQAVHACN